MALPYRNSSADPMKAQGRIQATLRKFGVGRIIFDDDVENKKITISFKYKDMPVSLPLDYGDLAKKFSEQDPYTSRKRGTRPDYEFKLSEQAYKAAYSMLDDLIKSMISIVNLGAYEFEEIFLGFFVNNNGVRVADIIVPRLKEGIGPRFQLSETNQ